MELNNRQFHANFGLSKATIIILFGVLQSATSHGGFTLDHILWTFYFLKVYNTVDVSAVHWKVDPKTYRLWVWKVIQTLFIYLDTVSLFITFLIYKIDLNDRFDSETIMSINMALDGTECAVERPLDNAIQRQYYSGKKRKHTIKYEIGVQLQTGKIVWLAGGVPGSVHDITLYQTCGLKSHLLPGEMVLADKGYVGDDIMIHPFKSARTEEEKEFNATISSIRQVVEHTYGRIKVFNFTQHKWRHDLDLHPMAFKVICHALNVEFESKPVHK